MEPDPLGPLQPSSEPAAGFAPLPFFLWRDTPVSWDLCASVPAAESPGPWANSLLWGGESLVVSSSSQGQPGMAERAGSVSPQPHLDLAGFPLAEIWDNLSPNPPAVMLPPVPAACLDPHAPWLMSRMNPDMTDPLPLIHSTLGSYPNGLRVSRLRNAVWQRHRVNLEEYSQRWGYLNTLDYLRVLPGISLQGQAKGDKCLVKFHTAGSVSPLPPLDPDGFPSPELWIAPPPSATPDPAPPSMAAACLGPTSVPPTSETNPARLGEIQAHVSAILSCCPNGLRVKLLVKRLLKEHRVDLLAISPDRGYRGVVSFLRQVPGIELWKPEKGRKSHALSCTFMKDVADPLPLLQSILGSYPNGLRVISLSKAMWRQHGVNLEEYSQRWGYQNTLDYLRGLPGISLQGKEKGNKCLVKLHTGVAVTPPTPQPPLDSAVPSACPSSSPLPEDALQPRDDELRGAAGESPARLDEIQAHVSAFLSCCPKGLRVKMLVKRLLKERGVDLLAISPDRGYQGVVSFLQQVPGIELWNPEKGEKSHALSCTFKKDVADPLPLIHSSLGSYPNGLRVIRLRKVMWQRHGVNLEEYSQRWGYLNALDYLRGLPGISLQGLEKNELCLVKLHAGAAVTRPTPQPPLDSSIPSACPSSNPLPEDPLQPREKGLRGAVGEPPDVADPLPLLQSILGSYPNGLRVISLSKAMWQQHRVNLEEYSQRWGYQNTLDYLRGLPGISLQGQEKGNKCLVKLHTGVALTPSALQPPPDITASSACPGSSPQPDAPLQPGEEGLKGAEGEPPGWAEVAAWVQEVLGRFPLGLRVSKLKKVLQRERGLDLEVLSRQQGCGDALGLLRAVPQLCLRDPAQGRDCLACLATDATVTPPGPPLLSAWPGGSPPPPAPAAPLPPQRPCGAAEPDGMAELIWDVLGPYPLGLRVKKLKELLVRKFGANLESIGHARGYGDVLSFLGGVPGLTLQGSGESDKCLVKLQRGPASGSGSLCSGSACSLLQTRAPQRPASPATSCLNPHLPSATTGRRLLPSLPSGQELFCTPTCLGPNPHLPAWSQSPAQPTGRHSGLRADDETEESRPRPASAPLVLREEEGTQESVARPASAPLVLREKEGTQESRTRPASAPLVLREGTQESEVRPASAPLVLREKEGTQESRTRPASAPLVLQEGTQESGVRPTSTPLVLQEGTQESGVRPTSTPLALREEQGTQESGMRPVSIPLALREEQGTQKPGAQLGTAPQHPRTGSPKAPASQPHEDLAELKRKVGAILARHPGGMSLFQFRVAYSTTHQHPLPLAHAASTKQWLAQMPDIVRLQGCGVQTQLLPVVPNSPRRGEPGLALWIPHEGAALAGNAHAASEAAPALAELPASPAVPGPAGDPRSPAMCHPALAKIPLVPPVPSSAGSPNSLAEPPSVPAAPAQAGEPNIPSEPPPALARPPPVPAAPTRAGNPSFPSDPLPALARPPPVPAAPTWAGNPNIPSEPLPVPPAPTRARHPSIVSEPPSTVAAPPPVSPAPTQLGYPDTLTVPPPTLPAMPLGPTAPAPAGDPHLLRRPPPTFVTRRSGQSPQHPEAMPQLPSLVPSAPVVLPAAGSGSSLWGWRGAESPPAPCDPLAAARPVIYPPLSDRPPVPAGGPALPPQAHHSQVQVAPPLQGHPRVGGRAPCQAWHTPAAVRPTEGPISADPFAGPAVSPAKQLSRVALAPCPPPAACVLATSEQGWPESRRPPAGEGTSPPLNPSQRCSLAPPAPSAQRNQLGPQPMNPSTPLSPMPPRHTDSCVIL
ncbi:uncharacterized protein LOC142024733 isoform X2 [Carettochelys insculpta]|uniref:uncharacterized protein LOC142024733 isoform X2 n=1 Tax=Carettochelys insculpta TaxID=44489 RepID=UPI003EB8B856